MRKAKRKKPPPAKDPSVALGVPEWSLFWQ